MRLWLGQATWKQTFGLWGWAWPEGVRFALDLRTIAEQSGRQSTSPTASYLFITDDDVQLAAPAVQIASDPKERVSDNTKQQLRRIARRDAVYGARVDDLIWSACAVHGDPEGVRTQKPLMPEYGGRLALHFGPIHLAEQIEFDRPEWPAIQAAYQRGYRELVKETERRAGRFRSRAPKNLIDHPRRVLSAWCDELGLDIREYHRFIPSDMEQVKPLPHQTTQTESFDTADGETLGPDQTWSEFNSGSPNNAFKIVSNQCNCKDASDFHNARCDGALSSGNMQVEVVITDLNSGSANFQAGPAARHRATAGNYYFNRALQINDTYDGGKLVGASYSSVLSAVSITVSLPQTAIITVNGSTIGGSYDGTNLTPQSDLSHGPSDAVVGGLAMFGIDAKVGSWTAFDFGGGGGDPDPTFTLETWVDYDNPDCIVKQYRAGGTVVIRGTYSNYEPTGVEYRLDGGSWTALGNFDATDGTWSGEVTAGGGEYALEVRDADDDDLNGEAVLVVANIIAIVSDSTAVNEVQNNQPYDGDGPYWRGYDSLGDRYVRLTQGKSFTPLIATELALNEGIPVVTMALGASGTRFQGWQGTSDYYNIFRTQLLASGCGIPAAILCQLGSNDASTTYSPAVQDDIEDQITVLADLIAEDFDDVPFFVCLMGEVPGSRTDIDAVRKAILAKIADDTVRAGIVLVDQAYSDHIHPYSDANAEALGFRWAALLLKEIWGESLAPSPTVTAAVRLNADTIRVTFSGALAGSAGDATYGWRVVDAVGAMTISSALRYSTNQVDITVSTTIIGATTVSLGSNNDATGVVMPGATVTLPSGETTLMPAYPAIDFVVDSLPPLGSGESIVLDEKFAYGSLSALYAVWEPRIHGQSTYPNATFSADEYAAYVDPRNLAVANPFSLGANGLTITARKASTIVGLVTNDLPDDPKTGSDFAWASGTLQARATNTFRRGILDVIAGPFTADKSTWPAVWARPVGGNGRYPEWDMFEVNGDDAEIANFNIIQSASLHNARPYTHSESLFLKSHWYRTEANDTEIIFSLDGEVVDAIDISDKPDIQALMYPIISLAVGSNISGWVPAPDGGTPNTITGVYSRFRIVSLDGPDSLSLSESATLNTITGAIAQISHTAFGASTGGTYTILDDDGLDISISGDDLIADTALPVGSYVIELRVTDVEGKTWERDFPLSVVRDTIIGTNQWTAPTALTNAAWNKYDVSIESSGLRIQETATTAHHALSQLITKPAAIVNYEVAIDIGAAEREWVRVEFANNFTDPAYLYVNLTTGEFGDVSSSNPSAIELTSYFTVPLASGLRRIAMYVTVAASVTSLRMQLKLVLNGSDYATRLGNVSFGIAARPKMQLSDGKSYALSSTTLGAATLTAAASVQVTASFAKTLAAATLASVASVQVTAALVKTLASATLVSAASVQVNAALVKTLANATMLSAGGEGDQVRGNLNVTLAPATMVAAASVQVNAALSKTLDSATLSSQASSTVRGSVAVTLDNATLVSNNSAGITASLSKVLADATIVAHSTVTNRANLLKTLGDATLTSYATTQPTGPGPLAMSAIHVGDVLYESLVPHVGTL